jgi:hypothetical protein
MKYGSDAALELGYYIVGVEADVDAAFGELECCAEITTVSHGGDIAAFWDAHGCLEGWLCKNHLKNWLERNRPYYLSCESLQCTACKRVFTSVDDFAKVWVL